jgi:tetratricopeptide (TPR) repeat protein
MKTLNLLILAICLVAQVAWGQPKPAQAAYKKAISYLNKGKLEKGFALLDKALQADSLYREAWYAKGYYAFGGGDYPKALQAFNRLVGLYPGDTTFYRYRALTYMYLEDYPKAETDLRKALSLDATDANTWNDLGYLYYQWGKPQEAQLQFEQSLKIKPNKTAWYYKALVQYDRNQSDQALTFLENSLKEDPRYDKALRLKANLLTDRKQYGEAVKLYDQLAANGNLAHPDDLLDWGIVYYKMKKYPEALAYFTMPENHRNALLHYYAGLTHYRMKQTPEALKALDKAVQYADTADESYAPLFYDRSVVRFQSGDKKGAVTDLLKAAYLMPEVLQRRNVQGDTIDLLASAPLMLKGLYSQKQLNAASAAGYRDRAEALLDSEDGEVEALKAVNQALRMDSLDAGSYFLRGRILYLTASYPEALQDYNFGFRLAKGSLTADNFYLRGLTYFELEQYEPAHEDFSEAIRMNNQESAYYYDRSYAAAALGDYEEALQDINMVLRLEKNDSAMLLVRAGFYNEMGRYKDALTDCNQVIKADDANAMAYCLRGYAFEKLRQKNEAISDYAKALQLDPQLNDARVALEELSGFGTQGRKVN